MLFWFLFILATIFGIWGNYDPAPNPFRAWGGWFIQFILIGLIGWQVFGSAVK
jgi:hypothetical protein